MHVIIAGAARTGKTTLSLMLNECGFTHYKMDSIKRGICDAYNLTYDNWEDVSPIMCKIINRVIEDNKTDTNYNKEKYLFDTPFIFPKDINLINTENTLVIFLGCAHLSVEEEIMQIRNNDTKNLWTYEATDEKLRSWLTKNIAFSKYIEEECKKLNIIYYDTSFDRSETLNEIKDFIISKTKE